MDVVAVGVVRQLKFQVVLAPFNGRGILWARGLELSNLLSGPTYICHT